MINFQGVYTGPVLDVNHSMPLAREIAAEYGSGGVRPIMLPIDVGFMEPDMLAAMTSLYSVVWGDDTVRGRSLRSFASPADIVIGGYPFPIDIHDPDREPDIAAYSRPANLIGVSAEKWSAVLTDFPELARADIDPSGMSVAGLHKALNSRLHSFKLAQHYVSSTIHSLGSEVTNALYSSLSAHDLVETLVRPDGKITNGKAVDVYETGVFGAKDATSPEEGIMTSTFGNIALQFIYKHIKNPGLNVIAINVLTSPHTNNEIRDDLSLEKLDRALADTTMKLGVDSLRFVYYLVMTTDLRENLGMQREVYTPTSAADLIIRYRSSGHRRLYLPITTQKGHSENS